MGDGKSPLEKFLGLEPPARPRGQLTAEQAGELSEQEGIIGQFAKGGGLKDVTLPDRPEIGEQERLRLRAIAERLRKAMLTGRGRAATVATSPRGVTSEARLRRRQLTGV